MIRDDEVKFLFPIRLAFIPLWVAFPLALIGEFWSFRFLIVSSVLLSITTFAALLLFIVHEVVTKLQWRLLEFGVTLVGGTIPTAVMIRWDHLTTSNMGWSGLVNILLSMFAGIWVSLTCSAITNLYAKQVREDRSLQRLGLLCLVWGALFSFAGLIAALILLILIFCEGHVVLGPQNSEKWRNLILYSGTLLIWIPIFLVNRRYRTRGGINVQR